MSASTPNDSERERARLFLQNECAEIGKFLAAAVQDAAPEGKRWNFVLVMCTSGEPPCDIAYASNVVRTDAIEILEEIKKMFTEEPDGGISVRYVPK